MAFAIPQSINTGGQTAPVFLEGRGGFVSVCASLRFVCSVLRRIRILISPVSRSHTNGFAFVRQSQPTRLLSISIGAQ
jgi:hypothetical protein